MGKMGRLCDVLTDIERGRVLTEEMHPYNGHFAVPPRCFRDVVCGVGSFPQPSEHLEIFYQRANRVAFEGFLVGCYYDEMCARFGVPRINAAIRDRVALGKRAPTPHGEALESISGEVERVHP